MLPARKVFLLATIAACLVSALLAASAGAASAVHSDCNDGSIDGKYSASELKRALSTIPADLDEYSDCRSLIQQALLAKVSNRLKNGKGERDSAALAAASTPAQRRRAARQAERLLSTKLPQSGSVGKIGGTDIERSGARTLASSAAPGLPWPMVLALAGLLLLVGTDLAGRLGKSSLARDRLRRFTRRGSG